MELLRSDGAAVEDALSGTDPKLMKENMAVPIFVISLNYGNKHSYGRLSDKEEPDINVNITVYC